jgi:peptidoglycan pentaglycine glycine transferase (the first glycine)
MSSFTQPMPTPEVAEIMPGGLSQQHWDDIVSSTPNCHFMQSYAWGELQSTAGWEPHYLTIGSAASPRAVALLLSRIVPVSGHRVFYCPRGPVFLDDQQETIMQTAGAVRAYIRARRGIFARFDPYQIEAAVTDQSYAGAGLLKVKREWSYWNAPKFVFWLDLDRDETALFKGTSANCQRDLKAGYKKAVEYSLGTEADLGDFHRLMVQMSSTKGIAVHDEAYYRRVYAIMNKSCQLELFVARFEGSSIASGMSVRYGRTAWLLYAASDREHSKLGSSRNLQWEMIKWARGSGCTRYDFRGTATGDPPNPNDPGYGVYQFKKSFGPEFIRLAGYYDLVGQRTLYSALRSAEERLLPAVYRAKVWLDERR